MSAARALQPDLCVRAPGEGLPEGFLDLPRRIHFGDEDWTPEEPDEVERAFHPENPYFELGQAALFSVPGEVRGAVFYAPGECVDDPHAAFFGYWETRGDPDAERCVMHAMESWARAKGARSMCGPANFNLHGACRLRLHDHREWIPFPGEPHNPLHYVEGLRRMGFQEGRRCLTQRTGRDRSHIESLVARGERLAARGYRLEAFTPDHWHAFGEELYQFNSDVWRQNYRFTPLSREQFQRVYAQPLARRMCPHSSSIVFGPEGDIAAISLCSPSYGSLTAGSAGAARVRPRDLRFHEHHPRLRAPRLLVIKTCAVALRHRGGALPWWVGSAGMIRGWDHYDGYLIAMQQHPKLFARNTRRVCRSERIYALFEKAL